MSHSDINLDISKAFEEGASAIKLKKRYGLGSRSLVHMLAEARDSGFLSDHAFDRLLVERRRYEFPEDPESRLMAVLCCINSELKQGTLLILDDRHQTCSDLRRKLSERLC